MPPQPIGKRQIIERLLGQGMVLVHLDARVPGTRVPEKLGSDPQLRLNLSYRFSSRDLEVGEEWISCTLSFSGMPFRCVLPLRSVYAATSHVTGESVVWPDDVPEEVATAAAEPPAPDPEGPKTPPGGAPGQAPDGEQARPKKSRGHLRLVK